MPVMSFAFGSPTGKVVVAIHGGAYVGEATLFHWWTYAQTARRTRATPRVAVSRCSPCRNKYGGVRPRRITSSW